MMDQPLPPASNGRLTNGQFGAGNKYGRGNPNLRKMHALRAKLLDAVTPEAMEAIGRKLVESAEGGDLDATKILLGYTIGRPPQALELSGADGEPLAIGMAEMRIALVKALEPFGPAAKVAIAQALMSLSRSATGRTDEEEDTGRWSGG